MIFPISIEYFKTRNYSPWPLLLIITVNIWLYGFLAIYLNSKNPELAKALYAWAAREDSGIGHLVVGNFFHRNWVTLLFNMWFLWLFGQPLVRNINAVHFFVLYLAAGALGTFVQDIFTEGGSVGASASVAGVMGFCLVRHASAKIVCVILLPVRSYYLMRRAGSMLFGLPAWGLICLYIAFDIFNAVYISKSSIAAVAHLSGSAVGILSGLSASWHDKRTNQQTNKPRRPRF